MREIYAKNVPTIDLGRQGENLVTQVIYDLSDWIAEYGDGTAELIHKRIGDSQPYPVAAVRDGNTLIWTITSTDTAVATRPLSGYGQCELRWYSGDVLAKSKTWKTMVSRAMEAPSETAPPDPEQGWVDQVLAAGASAKEAADKAFSALSNAPYIGDNGNWYLGGTDTGKPSRGEAGPALAVTNTAAVGQTVKITAVDENGQPTEWEAADMASGGGEEAWDYEKTIVIEEEVASLTIDTFDDGTPLALKKVEVILVGSNATSANQGVTLMPDYDLASNKGAVFLGGGSYLTANKKHYLWGIAEINNGEVAAEFAQSNNQTQYTNFYNGISSDITKVKPGITFSGEAVEIYPRKATKFISIKADVPAGAFAVGTILRIKGVMV